MYHSGVSPFGGASHQRGKHRRWLITVMLFMSYDTESQSRNADFISIAAERQSTTLGLKGRQTYEPSGPKGPVNPKNLFLCPLSGSEHNPSTQPAAPAAPLFLICGEAATTTLGPKGRQT